MVSLDAGYMQRFNPGYVRGPGSAINSVIFTNRWEFMCIFKLCSVFTPHWLIGHGRWGRARGSTNHSWRQSTNHRAGSSCLGFGQHMYCYSVILKKWMVQNENTYERQCTQCPAGTRTRPATRYFFRYPTRPDSVLEIIG